MSAKDPEHGFRADTREGLEGGRDADVNPCSCESGSASAECHGAPREPGSGLLRFGQCVKDGV